MTDQLQNEDFPYSIFDNMMEGCQIIGNDWYYVYINKAAEKQNNRPKTELIGKRYMDMWPGLEETQVFAEIKKCMEERISKHWDTEYVFPDGRIGWFDVRVQPIPIGILILSIDITARKSAEKILREKDENLRFLGTIVPGVLWMSTPDISKILYVSENYKDIWGQSVESLYENPLSYLDPIHPDDREKVINALSNHAKGHYEVEFRLIGTDGTIRWMHDKGIPILDEEGNIVRMGGLANDITGQKRTQERIEQLSRRFELILNSAGEGIYGLDIEGKTTFINPAGLKMLGYESEELVGKLQHAIIHHTRSNGTHYPKEECFIYATFKDGEVHHIMDEVFWRKDGSFFPVEYTSTPIWENDKVVGAVVIFNDITERKEKENEILKLNESLHAKIRERTKELAEAYGDLIKKPIDWMKRKNLLNSQAGNGTLRLELKLGLKTIINCSTFRKILDLALNFSGSESTEKISLS